MHQPYYREGLDGEYQLPWVYLHALKDYDDMAAHLERHPNMRLVVNFAPVLLEQLDDYANQIKAFLEHGKATQDPLLNLLAGATAIPADANGRRQVVETCSRAHAPLMIDPYPHFHAMLRRLHPADQDPAGEVLLEYLNEQYFIDLVVWYHLAWTSHNLKQTTLVRRLMEKARRFTKKDRLDLLRLFHKTLQNIIPRYRKLASSGQVELSMTPWGHPIIPLLDDFNNMRETQPDAPMPEHARYPNGMERARWHLEEGLRVFKRYFGFEPKGVWLSEGGISDDALMLLDELGMQWTASGEAVWHHSCINSACDPGEMACRRALFIPYQLDELETRVHFRDDGLSDLIGFEYSKWHADDAVADFVGHLERISDSLGEDAHRHVVAVILDGENAWEYYPDNGHHFLDALYKRLSNHPEIETTTFADVQGKVREEKLQHLVPGSWVYGSFSTWIGSADKNRAWDLLVEVKLIFDQQV
ncbi:MAG TPA: glycoside hydrolase, partial [Chromatiaceae bacterium]|nr:glycoside hydrolase [Chromatiaceae bacterium]